MPAGRKRDLEREAQICVMYQAGHRMPAIASTFGISVSTVWAALAAAGVERRSRTTGAPRGKRSAKIFELHRRGLAVWEIANTVRVSDSAVRAALWRQARRQDLRSEWPAEINRGANSRRATEAPEPPAAAASSVSAVGTEEG